MRRSFYEPERFGGVLDGLRFRNHQPRVHVLASAVPALANAFRLPRSARRARFRLCFRNVLLLLLLLMGATPSTVCRVIATSNGTDLAVSEL